MSKHRMKRRTKVFLVAVIVIVAAGGIFHHEFGGGVEAHADRFIDRVDRELHLDESQLAALHGLKSDLLRLRREMREVRTADVDRLVDLVTAPTLDRQALLGMLEKKTQAINERAPEVVASVARFTDSLSASQKAILREEIAQKRYWLDRHRHWHGG